MQLEKISNKTVEEEEEKAVMNKTEKRSNDRKRLRDTALSQVENACRRQIK